MIETNQIKYECLSDIPDSLLEIYRSKKLVAVDTELHGLKLYRDEICLVQLCDDDKNNVCLVKPDSNNPPENLKKLLTDPEVMKVFHFALTDVAFFKTSLNIQVHPFNCTKVMSKLVRTYTDGHGLKDLCLELLGVVLEKQQQQTDWARPTLSHEQLKYAASDVLYLVEIYQVMKKMIAERPTLSTGGNLEDLNTKAQAMLPGLIELLVHGYGDLDRGWQTTLFQH